MVAAGLLLGGCAARGGACPGGSLPAPAGSAGVAPAPDPGAPPPATAVLTLYFANPAYVASGDETIPHLVTEARPAPTTADPAAAALRELLEVGPRAGGAAVAPPGLRARVTGVADGVVTVDFDRDGLAGGSLMESLLLSAIVWTLTELPAVSAVRVTVAGAPAESLMGHLDTTRPLRRADLGR
ncbi:MAG TPA: GerMN domain-containing protein [Polyangiaceae bacterium]|nr:GerMN domain-containing protein [Polyangiaceae bacterium]